MMIDFDIILEIDVLRECFMDICASASRLKTEEGNSLSKRTGKAAKNIFLPEYANKEGIEQMKALNVALRKELEELENK